MKRHDLWRRVELDYQEARKRAVKGYEPVVQVFLVGRELPVELGFVETRRGLDESWIRFEAAAPEAAEGDNTIPRECFWMHVHESSILRVEIIFRPIEKIPLGYFRVHEADEPAG